MLLVDYDEQVQSLVNTVLLGYQVEREDPRIAFPTPSRAEVEWLAAWILSEGWQRAPGWPDMRAVGGTAGSLPPVPVDEEPSSRLDYQLALNSFVTMFWSPAVLNDAASWLSGHGYDIRTGDASDWFSEREMHRALAALLGFPSYYGHNLDALNDCLSDVAAGDYAGSRDSKGLALVLWNYDRFTAAAPQVAFALLDVFARQARNAAIGGRVMLCLIQSNDPRLSISPVGATPVVWNAAEWANSRRGV